MSSTLGGTPSRPSTVADRELSAASGYLALVVALALVALSLFFAFARSPFAMGFGIVAIIAAIVVAKGLVVLQPNESLVCLLFGSYVGTERRAGFWWVNPFFSRKKVSRRLETLECGPLKVNDAVGNPVDIGAVIVWRVEDAAKAVLEVESYAIYVKAQSETAVRRMASTHPYDDVEVEEAAEVGRPPTTGDGQQISAVTLRGGGDAIIESLLTELRGRMDEGRYIGCTPAERAGGRLNHTCGTREPAARPAISLQRS
jgi:SPFH domain / Band 7 family